MQLLFNVRVATTVDDGVAVTFNVGDVVTIDVIVVVYAGTVVDVDVVNACRKKKLSPQSKIDPLRDLRFVLYDNIKKIP